MELKEGFKQTEIGVIPNDWNLECLGDVAEVVGGGTPSTFTKSFWDGNINWFTPTEIGKHKYAYESERKITKEGLDNCSARLLPTGTVLLTSRAGIGDVAILVNESCTNQGFQSLLANDNSNNEFLYYLISTLKSVLLQNASGSTFLEISPKHVKAIKIPIPPLPEQQAIAEVLSDIDALITSLDELIEKKRNIKQGSMQLLLTGKKRLAGFTGDWETRALGDVAEVVGGGTPSTFNKKSWDGNINWFTPTEVGRYKYVYESERKITKEGLDSCSARMLPSGTVLLTTRAGIGDVAILVNESCTNQGFQSLIANENSNNEFLYYLISTLKSLLVQNASGSTFLEISPKTVKAIRIPLPPAPEQEAIASLLSDMDAELESLERHRVKYFGLKQGMMQELLTGKTRLL